MTSTASSTIFNGAGPRITVLGGGPAGVGAAYMLSDSGKATPFMLDGVHCDFGSHRLHPASDPEILDMIRKLLGDDLLVRPRHGRIRLKGSWIHFPLKPADLLMKMPKGFALTLLRDMATKPLRKGAATPEAETFATILHKELGPAMCEEEAVGAATRGTGRHAGAPSHFGQLDHQDHQEGSGSAPRHQEAANWHLLLSAQGLRHDQRGAVCCWRTARRAL